MSTKAIRKVIDDLASQYDAGDPPTFIQKARAEVEAIEKAAQDFYVHGYDASNASWGLMDAIGEEVMK